MAIKPNAFLVVRREDGFEEAIPLTPGTRCTLGRAPANRIVLRDDMCSREHAEVYADGGAWTVRDLGSLNGTHLNGEQLREEQRLRPRDEVRVGQTTLLFTPDLQDLPARPIPLSEPSGGIEIKRRLGHTKFLAAAPATGDRTQTGTPADRLPAPEALAVLYKLALDMADASTAAELGELVVEALFQATPAEVAAVLALKEGRDLEPLVYRLRNPGPQTYHKVSSFVSREVLTTRLAVLAENVAAERHLNNRDSITELRAASLICAPIVHEGQILGLLHLYRTAPAGPLNADDLEFALACAGQLGQAWHRLRRQAGLAAENRTLRSQLQLESGLIGDSTALHTVATQVARVADTRATVLIRGESGVGKELVARAIHQSGPRRDRAFICLNCAALTETLLESELFGHEKGSFTGATERMIGKFEAADEGTIFLDEIGEMAPGTQAKFLRVLEGQSFERVGGNTPIAVDVRVVAATNRPLEAAVRAGTFRRDLFYRLQVVQIDVPPLRDRSDDVESLAEHFLKRFIRETGRKIHGFTPEAVAKLRAHSWPGNVRELRNVVERAVALGVSPVIDAADVWLSELDVGGADGEAAFRPGTLDEVEKRHILATLRHTEWNKSQAAASLGIERSTLDRKIKSYDLKR